MSFSNFEMSTYNHYVKSEYREYALSVFCLTECDGDEIASLADLRNDKYKESTVGQVRAIGYDVVPDTPPAAHALVKQLPSPPSREDWQKLKAVFSKEKANPNV